MVKKKIAFVLAVFCATVLLMAVQKPVFLAYYAADAAQASVGEEHAAVVENPFAAVGVKLDFLYPVAPQIAGLLREHLYPAAVLHGGVVYPEVGAAGGGC
jgi:hypothetical protein